MSATAGDPRLAARAWSHWSTAPGAALESLGASGGFSGARFWRIRSDAGDWCLRQWPDEHPPVERLLFIHGVLEHAAAETDVPLPAPRPARDGSTLVECDGRLWELSPWLPGEADFERHPSPLRLQAALLALAEFHRAAGQCPLWKPRRAASPGLISRYRQLVELQDGLAELIAQQIAARRRGWDALHPLAERVLAGFRALARVVEPRLRPWVTREVNLQPCIRDIWHDHLLFEEERLTGILDFGAMREETVAADLARLLGSLGGDDAEFWQLGLTLYQSARRLSIEQLELIDVFDRSTVILAGMNWLDWIYVQERAFEDRPAVERRMRHWIARLEHARSVAGA